MLEYSKAQLSFKSCWAKALNELKEAHKTKDLSKIEPAMENLIKYCQ